MVIYIDFYDKIIKTIDITYNFNGYFYLNLITKTLTTTNI